MRAGVFRISRDPPIGTRAREIRRSSAASGPLLGTRDDHKIPIFVTTGVSYDHAFK